MFNNKKDVDASYLGDKNERTQLLEEICEYLWNHKSKSTKCFLDSTSETKRKYKNMSSDIIDIFNNFKLREAKNNV